MTPGEGASSTYHQGYFFYLSFIYLGKSGNPIALHPLGLQYFFTATSVRAEDGLDIDGTVEDDLGKSRDGSKTDDEVVQR
uniref:Uncharacterized protein n=1 Tax=Oncorhynchus mykiss TaxID=8022 RepID=A0A8C7V8D3_ONCMY